MIFRVLDTVEQVSVKVTEKHSVVWLLTFRRVALCRQCFQTRSSAVIYRLKGLVYRLSHGSHIVIDRVVSTGYCCLHQAMV